MKTKLIIITVIAIFCGICSFSQENVGIGTTNPHASALLDLTSSSKGLLIPRVELISVNNGVAPVNSPATGLLVFNETGALDHGFYYWDGSQWVMVGTGGGISECVSLEQAYNCNGSGLGREINANSGAVEITLPIGGIGDAGLEVYSDKGSIMAPTMALYTQNSQQGVGVFSQITNPGNVYSAIQGISYSNLTGADLPSGISGYHDGTGLGVGVWGETSSNSTAGPSYGVYGISTGNGHGFGGYFFSYSYPGIFVETNLNTAPAAQFAAAAQSPLNPAMLSVGWKQFNCGQSVWIGGHNIFFDNIGEEATIAPDDDGYGFLGVPGLAWWEIHYYSAIQASRKELKRDINYIDDNIAEFIMSEIESLKPAFYKYKTENDELIPGQESKTRYNMRLGVMVEESPDFIQNNAFSGIDIYSLATLSICGVQHNRNSIVKLEEKINEKSLQISDFGIAKMEGNSVRVNFAKDFKGSTPIVSITPNSPVSDYYIKEQDSEGFVIAVKNPQNFMFNWIAMAKVEKSSEDEPEFVIDPGLKSQLRVDDHKKSNASSSLIKSRSNTLQLSGTTEQRANAKRFEQKEK